MNLVLTPAIHDVLLQASSSASVSETCRALAAELKDRRQSGGSASSSDCGTVPWASLKLVVEELRRSSPAGGPWLHELCRGGASSSNSSSGGLALVAPVPRTPSPAAAARLVQLQNDVDNKRYAAMVADVTVREREAEERRNAILPTLQLQSSFVLHVIVTMGTFYAFGYYAGKIFFGLTEVWAIMSGTVGLMFALLLETTLLILRSNMPVPLEERFPDLVNPRRYNAAFAQQKQQAAEEKEAARKKKEPPPAPAPPAAKGAGGGKKKR